MQSNGSRYLLGLHPGWYVLAFVSLWATVFTIRIALQLAPPSAAAEPDFFFSWLFLAGALLLVAGGFAATWAVILLHAHWLRPVRSGGATAARTRAAATGK